MATGKGRFIQSSFNAGEISPLLYSRHDLEKYKNSCIELRNFITFPQGPAVFRSGSKYITTAKPAINPTWTAIDPGNGDWKALAWSPSLRLFVLMPVAASGTKTVLTSTDGITWTANITTVTASAVWESVVWADKINLFVAVASTNNVNSKRIVTSPDGVNWSEQTQSIAKAWRSVCWSSSLRLLVAVADDASGTNCIMTSPDAVTWTTRTAPEASAWTEVIWAEALTLFVAVAETGTSRVMTSPDGITWTGRTAASANNWKSVCWSSDLSLLIGVANTDTSGEGRIMKSSNGTTWTSVTGSSASAWEKIIWSSEMNLFWAVANSGTYRIMYSATGLSESWTTIAAPAALNWEDIVYSPELDRLVGAASNTTGNTVMYYGGSGTVVERMKVRLLPFKFSSVQAYILEMGHAYMRFYREEDIITNPSQQISGITKANPAVVTYTGADNFANGDRVIIRDVLGMTEVNNREFEVANVNTGANTFELYGVNSTAYTTYVSGGKIMEIVEVSTPYDKTKLFDIKTCQSADIQYLWHGDYQPRKLARTSHVDWTITAIDFKSIPTGELDFDMKLTKSVTSITRVTTTATATVTAHAYQTGMSVTISGANETEYNGTFVITNTGANTFTYVMTADPGASATGTIIASSTTLKPLSITGDKAVFLAGDEIFFDADVERIIKHGVSRGTITELYPISINSNIKTAGAITRSGTTATATFTGHGFSTGNNITILGAKQDLYNGTFKITVVDANIFTYALGAENRPHTPATTDTDIICYLSPKGFNVSSISRSGTEATVTTGSAHGFIDGDIVKIEKANESKWNNTFEVKDVPSSTTFIVTVTDEGETSSTGSVIVTKKAPTNVVSVDVSDDFTNTDVIAAGSWYLIGSPQAKLTFSKKKPIGSMVKITADKKAFREADIGKHIRFPRSDSGSYTNIEIKTYTSHKEVRGKIIQTIHKDDDPEVAAGEWTLEQKMWSNALGWPSVGAFFEDRLWVARDDTLWASAIGDYENFNIGVKDDSSIQFTLGSRQVNPIRWIEPKQGLIIGTTGDIWKIEGQGEPITPSNINNKKVVISGSSDSVAVDTSGALLYIHRLGKEIGEILYSIEEDGLISNEITLWAEHLFKYGIKEIVYQDKPVPIVWAIMNTGELCGCTYLRRQEVAGWYKIATPYGFYDSAAVIPGSKHDQLWVGVLRQINGTNVRHIEKFAPVYGTELDDWLGDTIDTFNTNVGTATYTKGYYVPYDVINMYTNTKGESAFLLDAGITQDIITTTTTISGLWHLNGMSVYAVINGAVVGPYTVSAGKITLAVATGANAVVHAGLAYNGVLRVARQEVQLEDGTTKGSVRIVKGITVQIYGSGLFKFGDSESNIKAAKFLQSDSTVHTLFTGDAIGSGFPGRHGYQADIAIVQDQPLPLIINSIVQVLEVAT